MQPITLVIVVLFIAMVAVQLISWITQLSMFLHRYFGLQEHPDMRSLYSSSSSPQPCIPVNNPKSPTLHSENDIDNDNESKREKENRTEPNESGATGHTEGYSFSCDSGPWVVITGGSSGQGREFALQFASKGFHVVLIGSQRSHTTAELVRLKGVDCLVIVKDFGKACEPNFFEDIERALAPLDCAILVNNIGHRTGWIPFHETPTRSLQDTIVCGTIVQTRLTHMLLPKLLRRIGYYNNTTNHSDTSLSSSTRSAVIFITAQCMHPNTGFAVPGFVENAISVPYLATYEASNAFGYYHACSLIQEYGDIDRLDMINITPGAVLTENTTHVLRDAPFAVDAATFVRNIMRFMGGNIASGTTCAYWGHALSNALVGFAPWKKTPWLRKVGESIAKDYMGRYEDRAGRYEDSG